MGAIVVAGPRRAAGKQASRSEVMMRKILDADIF
jgi:hypothetical protein